MEPLFTAGAQRALKLASHIAHEAATAEVQPVHLLWALWLDGSQAADILARQGIVRSSLEQLCAIGEQLSAESAATGHRHPHSADLVCVLDEARQHVALLGRHIEIGSEHLLMGLSAVNSPAQTLLHRHGLSPADLTVQVAERRGVAVSPIAAEVRLSLPASVTTDYTDTLRIIDAAANRACEGLRVLEDYVRFALDDAHLTRLLKEWRHEFARALALVEPHGRLAARDTVQDVGTAIHTRQEERRESLLAVVQANFKRVQEASRTLEECGKVLAADLGQRLGQLRYQLYTLEKAVLIAHGSRERLAGRDLYLLVTESLCPHGSGPVIHEALANGVGIVQVREKQMPDRRLLEHAQRVREWTKAADALFIMNDRPDLAVLADADGVHVGQDELSVRDARRIVGPNRIVGVSTHTIEQARQAVLDGADYIGVGPVFPSKTKSFDNFAGLEFVKEVTAEISLPGFAIGGIGPDNVEAVCDTGAQRIAVSGAICGAADPGQITRDLLAALDAKRASHNRRGE